MIENEIHVDLNKSIIQFVSIFIIKVKLLILILSLSKSIRIWFVVKFEVLETKLRDSCINTSKNIQNVMMLFERMILKWVNIYMKKIVIFQKFRLQLSSHNNNKVVIIL